MKKWVDPDISRFIRRYSQEIEQIPAGCDRDSVRAEHLVMIGFLQNERMAHLHVLLATIGFLLMSVILMVLSPQWGTALLFLLFLGLTIPYVIHYLFLENTIQRWYVRYRQLSDQNDGVM